MRIETKYNIGEIVYLRTDDDQKPHMVTQISIRVGGMLYELVCGDNYAWHYEFHMSRERDVVKATCS